MSFATHSIARSEEEAMSKTNIISIMGRAILIIGEPGTGGIKSENSLVIQLMSLSLCKEH